MLNLFRKRPAVKMLYIKAQIQKIGSGGAPAELNSHNPSFLDSVRLLASRRPCFG